MLDGPKDKRITKESSGDEEYTPFIDSEEEESDDSYYIDVELLTDNEELIAMREKMKEAKNKNKKKDDEV